MPAPFNITATLDGRAVGFRRNGVPGRLDGAFFDVETGRRDDELDWRFATRPASLTLRYSPTPFGHEVDFLCWIGAEEIDVREVRGDARGEPAPDDEEVVY